MKKFMFDKATVERLLACPLSRTELEEFLSEKRIFGLDLSEEGYTDDTILAKAIWYAYTHYPDSDLRDKLSFATMIQYFVTGMYGGFGLEEYEKEKLAEKLIMEMIGGRLDINTGFGLMPQYVLEQGLTAERTEECFNALVHHYFCNTY